jgi:hypothetical protein
MNKFIHYLILPFKMMVKIEFPCEKCGVMLYYSYQPVALGTICVYYKCISCFGEIITRRFLINFDEL